MTKFKLNDFKFFILLVAMLFFPFGIKIFGLTILDFAIASLIMLSFKDFSFKKITFLFFSLFIIILLFSTLLGIFFSDNFNFEKIIFFYKISLPFLLYLSLSSIKFNHDKTKKLLKIIFWLFLIMSVWVYMYYWLKFTNIIIGHTRVSFPMSEYTSSDAHLYSVYLAISFIFLIFTRDKYNYFSDKLFYFVLFIGLIATLMTASRSGVLLISVGLTFLVFNKLSITNLAKTIFYTLIFICILLISVSFIDDDFMELVSPLFERAFKIGVSNDDSVSTRLLSFQESLSETAKFYFLFGVGFFASSKVWYDGGLSTFIANSGLFGLLAFITLVSSYLLSVYKSHNKDFKYLLVIFILYAIANLITEYFLVTRSIFIFIIYIFILNLFINKKLEEK